METYSDYLAGIALAFEPPTHYCGYCGCVEKEHLLFLHEASNDSLCQACLVEYLASDIEVLGFGLFRGYEFKLDDATGEYSASKDGDIHITDDLASCVQHVLMKLDLI